MSISAAQYTKMLQSYMASPEGRKRIEEHLEKQTGEKISPFYTEDQMRAIAAELRDMVIAAYKREVRTKGADYFNVSEVHVGKPIKPRAKDGKIRLKVTFSSRALSRRSLHSIRPAGAASHQRKYVYSPKNWGDDYFTGKGVYDIFGLFTQGYDAKPVYGEWWDNEADAGEVNYFGFKGRSLTHREGSDFITKTIQEFKTKYPSIEVEYPRLWGGTK